MNLLLSGLRKRFVSAFEQELFTELLYEKMKEAGRVLSDKEKREKEAYELLIRQREETDRKRRKKKEAELLTKEEDRRLRRLSETLAAYETELKRRRPETGEEAFDVLRELFSQERERCEEREQEASETLEYAFDFLEAAFGDSQEMVVFLTGLNTTQEATVFLQNYSCERYERYNKSLLYRQSDQEIVKEIERLTGVRGE